MEYVRYFIDVDENSHWYFIPVSKRAEWKEWSEHDQDDYIGDAPEYAIMIDGCITDLTFTDPRQE